MRNDLAAGDCPDPDNATTHDAAPAARARLDTAERDSGNAAGTGGILTDEEVEALKWGIACTQNYGWNADGLRGLLERLGGER